MPCPDDRCHNHDTHSPAMFHNVIESLANKFKAKTPLDAVIKLSNGSDSSSVAGRDSEPLDTPQTTISPKLMHEWCSLTLW